MEDRIEVLDVFDMGKREDESFTIFHMDKDGKEVIDEEVTINILSTNHDNTDTSTAVIEKNGKGYSCYLKSQKPKYLDDLEVIIYEISKLLGIDVTKVERYKKGQETGIISYDVIQNDDENRVTMVELKDEYIKELPKHVPSWMKDYIGVYKGKPNNPVKSKEDVKKIIDGFFGILDSDIRNDKYEINNIKNKYIEMLIFDMLINQRTRSNGTYSIIKDSSDRIRNMTSLFNNSCFDERLGLNSDECILGSGVVKQEVLFDAICEYYSEYVIDIFSNIYNNRDEILKRVKEIVDVNINAEEGKKFFDNFNSVINRIYNSYKIMRLGKNSKEVSNHGLVSSIFIPFIFIGIILVISIYFFLVIYK